MGKKEERRRKREEGRRNEEEGRRRGRSASYIYYIVVHQNFIGQGRK
jgi:hypothetical protein